MTLSPTLDNLHKYGSWHALNTAYNDGRHKLAHNTYVVYRSDMGAYSVKYHNTYILTFYPPENGMEHVALDTNGWQTVTTKRRLNELLNQHQVYLYQEDHVWYVRLGRYARSYERTTAPHPDFVARTVEYYDGMVLNLSTSPPTLVN